MAKLRKVESLVEWVLETNKLARDDDFILVYKVYCEINHAVKVLDFREVMERHKEMRLPSFESITRARRKLQANNTDLRGSDISSDRRYKEWQDFRNYALDDDVPF